MNKRLITLDTIMDTTPKPTIAAIAQHNHDIMMMYPKVRAMPMAALAAENHKLLERSRRERAHKSQYMTGDSRATNTMAL